MKIEQDIPAFKPIRITLETREDADDFWGIAEDVYQNYADGTPQRKLLMDISNWFSANAKL